MQKLVKCGLGQLAGLHRAGVEKEPGSDESGRLQRHYFGEPESARATQVCRLQLCSRNFTLCSHASTLNSCSVEVSTLSLLRRSSDPSALSSATHRAIKVASSSTSCQTSSIPRTASRQAFLACQTSWRSGNAGFRPGDFCTKVAKSLP